MFQTIKEISAPTTRYAFSGNFAHKTLEPPTVIYGWIALSIAIHLLAIFCTHYLQAPKSSRNHQTTALKINIIQDLATHKKLLETRGRSDGSPIKKTLTKGKSEASATKSLSYSNLFPKNTDSTQELASNDSTPFTKADLSPDNLMEKTTIGRHYGLRGKRTAPEVERKLDEFATHIQVPLIWRNLAKESKAEATLRLDDSDVLIIESLYGEPMLRAVIFFGLSDQISRKKLKSDMRQHQIFRYRLILRYLPVNEPPSGLGLSIAAFSDGMVITKLLPQVMKQFPGVSLEDEESRRAKRREQAYIAKLMDSPAFAHSIVEYRLDRQ